MHSLVVYDSKFGNTEQIARAIDSALNETGPTEVRPFREVDQIPCDLDLLVVGGPTHAHGVDPALKGFIDALPPERIRDLAVAAFDTRYRVVELLTGSAARGISKRLRGKGARSVVPPESFFVSHGEGPLDEGELARAGTWARRLAVAGGVRAATN